MIYAWRMPGFYTADAQQVGEALEALDLKKRNGIIQEKIPFDEVWRAAQNPKSPLYDVLTRDKDEALRKLNRQEVRRMMSSLVVGKKQGNKIVPTKTRAFYYMYPGDEDNKVYIRRQKVNQTPSLRAQRTATFYRKLKNLAVEHDGNPDVTTYIRAIRKLVKRLEQALMMERV